MVWVSPLVVLVCVSPRGSGMCVSPVVVGMFSPWCWYVCFPRGVRVSPRGMCVFPVVGVRGFPPWYVCFPRGGGEKDAKEFEGEAQKTVQELMRQLKESKSIQERSEEQLQQQLDTQLEYSSTLKRERDRQIENSKTAAANFNFDAHFKRGVLSRPDAQDYFTVTKNAIDWKTIPQFFVGRPGYDNWLVDHIYLKLYFLNEVVFQELELIISLVKSATALTNFD